jgi:Na+/alanine symporter
MFRLLFVLVLVAGVAFAQEGGGAQLASDATSKVQAIATPLIAFGLALIALTIAISVIAYVNSRVPKD